ncbi:MAG: glycosyltransferase, partial [Chthoniobacterales bacterium]
MLSGAAAIAREIDAEGWICGDGPERERIAALVSGTSVRLLGYRDDVADLFRAADVFALGALLRHVAGETPLPAALEPLVDALIVVPNQRLLGIGDLEMTFKSAMLESNAVLADAVGGIAHLLVTPGLK